MDLSSEWVLFYLFQKSSFFSYKYSNINSILHPCKLFVPCYFYWTKILSPFQIAQLSLSFYICHLLCIAVNTYNSLQNSFFFVDFSNSWKFVNFLVGCEFFPGCDFIYLRFSIHNGLPFLLSSRDCLKVQSINIQVASWCLYRLGLRPY